MKLPSGNDACNGSMDARKQPVAIRIASFLCYAWGIILVVLTVTALMPLRSKPRALTAALAFLSIVVLVGAAYCLAGYLLRRRATSGMVHRDPRRPDDRAAARHAPQLRRRQHEAALAHRERGAHRSVRCQLDARRRGSPRC